MSKLQFGDFTLDRRLRELKKGDAVLAVAGKAFDLLSFMVANAGRPLSKAELLDAVWPDTAVEESNLSQYVFQLRKVLAFGEDGPIKTLSGRGYQFVAEVTEAETSDAARPGRAMVEPVVSPSAGAPAGRVVLHQKVEERSSRRLTGGRILVLLLVVALVGGLAWIWHQDYLDRSGGPPVQVVLMQMDGTTGDPILDKSLTQALRMDLGQSPFVTVVPASTVMATLKDMRHKPDEMVTLAMAREICERTNSQSVLSGNIAKVGQSFLILMEASNCVDGSLLGQAKSEAARAEELPHAIDQLASELRRKLGESRRSIARFNMPLFQASTPSLEALKAFTQGTQLIREGKISEAIAVLKTAVAADPEFAAAQYNLAAAYETVGDDFHLRDSIAKAYNARETASRSTRYSIETMYDSVFTGDQYELVRDFQGWVDLYPNSSQAWSGLASAQDDLGMVAEALASQQRTVELLPNSQGMLANLAMYQTRAGDLKAARATCERAIHDNLDGDGIRTRLLQLAYLLHDSDLLREQRTWEASHPQALTVLRVESEIAMAEGRFADAHGLIARIHDLEHQEGLSGPDDEAVKYAAVDLMQIGDVAAGKELFQRTPVDLEVGQEILGLVYVGDIPGAQDGVRKSMAKYPRATEWSLFWGPRINAAIAMAQNKPAEAAALLEASRPIDKMYTYLPWHRGNAYLACGQPAAAEKDFRSVIDNARFDPAAPYISLSWLGLGEALAAEGNRPAAVDAYQHFFTLWAHADPDAMYLKQAKEEFRKLQGE